MKNIVIFATLFFTATQSVKAQAPAVVPLSQVPGLKLGNPIQPYNESGYTVEYARSFALGQTGDPIASTWQQNMLLIINKGLVDAAVKRDDATPFVLTSSPDDINWVFDHVKDSAVSGLQNFQNSRRSGNNMDFFLDKGPFTGIIGVFQFRNCRILLYKTICLNLLNIPVAKPTSTVTTTKAYTLPSGETLHITNEINISNVGNSTATATVSGSGNSTVTTGEGGGYRLTGQQQQYTPRRVVTVRLGGGGPQRYYPPNVRPKPHASGTDGHDATGGSGNGGNGNNIRHASGTNGNGG
jgi:hypothetical protein